MNASLCIQNMHAMKTVSRITAMFLHNIAMPADCP